MLDAHAQHASMGGLELMPVNSRRKGARGELELANHLKEEFGWEARRTQQYAGHSGDASDVVISQMPSLHVEVKRVQHLNLTAAMAQAIRDCHGKTPTVWHRKDRGGWMVTLRLEDLISIAEMVVAAKCMKAGDKGTQSKSDSI